MYVRFVLPPFLFSNFFYNTLFITYLYFIFFHFLSFSLINIIFYFSSHYKHTFFFFYSSVISHFFLPLFTFLIIWFIYFTYHINYFLSLSFAPYPLQHGVDIYIFFSFLFSCLIRIVVKYYAILCNIQKKRSWGLYYTTDKQPRYAVIKLDHH